ncbi:cyclin-I isoform X2 [Pleurodeles waltl]|uniref:cyclin-I isoform X2 n=1 Tax=Pleurodeles waltl TaxID=8319 RepID=UPI0037099BFC
MKFSGPLESQRLSFLLEVAISKEAQMGKVYVPKFFINQDGTISPAQRDEVIRWLVKLKYQFGIYPETLALAISLLDRFLTTVKARPKYLRCIAVSCFFLAAKTIEEDEFHAVALSINSQLIAGLPKMNPSQHVAVLTSQLLQCMACSHLLQFKGSMLALAILSLEVEKLRPDWLALTLELLQKVKMDSSQLIHCRELVALHLSNLKACLPPNAVYIYDPLKQTLVTCNKGVFGCHSSSISGPGVPMDSRPEVPIKGTALVQLLPNPAGCKQSSAKRKVEEMEVDDFYDGIKRLYSEDSTAEIGGMEGVAAGCGTVLSRQEGSVSPCPPLQTVSVM